MTPLALQDVHPNMRKFLFLITKTEGTDLQGTPYNELYGYGNFTDFSKHPNIKVTKGGYTSTAAGRYQFLKRTWDGVQKRLNLSDFSPINQDRGAIQLIKDRGAYNDVINGDFEKAIQKTNKEWASLPGSPYGQPTYSLQRAMAFLNSLVETTTTYVRQKVKDNPKILLFSAFLLLAGGSYLYFKNKQQ
jgi:lysozyme